MEEVAAELGTTNATTTTNGGGASIKKQQHYIHYLLGAGFCFYFCWVLFSACGVFLASAVPNLDQYHLDFSIVATFIAIVVPFIKNLNTLVSFKLTFSRTNFSALFVLLKLFKTL